MSLWHTTKVWEEVELPDPEWRVLFALADSARAPGDAYEHLVWCSYAYLAWKCSKSRDTIKRAVMKLKERKVLVEVRPAQYHRPATYRVDLSAAPSKAPYEGGQIAPPETSEGASVRGRGGTGAPQTDKNGKGSREQLDAFQLQEPPGPDPVEQVFGHWKRVIPGREGCTLTADRRQRIESRLRHKSARELCEAVDGVLRDSWLMGDNPRERPYTDFSTIFKNDSKVEELITLARSRRRPAAPASVERLMPGMDGWVDPFPDS